MPHKDPEARRVYQRAYGTLHREHVRAYMREYRERNGRRPESPESMRRSNLKKLYGMTIEQYDTMFEEQSGLCALCGRPERRMYNGRLLRLSVDHDHQTRVIRRLLCHSCNTGLGAFEDSRSLLLRAVAYLDSHE